MNEELTPIPVGTVVNYHGSGRHGQYVITEHHDPRSFFSPAQITDEILAQAYPDNTAYLIWPVGVPQKMDNRHLMMFRVRRPSLTIVEKGN